MNKLGELENDGRVIGPRFWIVDHGSQEAVKFTDEAVRAAGVPCSLWKHDQSRPTDRMAWGVSPVVSESIHQLRDIAHLRLWAALAAEEDRAADVAVVLSGGTYVSPNFLDTWGAVKAEMPTEWDICFLDFWDGRTVIGQPRSGNNSRSVIRPCRPGMAGYALRVGSLQRLQDAVSEAHGRDLDDCLIRQAARLHLYAAFTTPRLCSSYREAKWPNPWVEFNGNYKKRGTRIQVRPQGDRGVTFIK